MNRLTTRILGPEGPLNAELCFIGQSPGGEENRTGIPFIGPAGQLLNRSMKASGLIRSEILIENLFAQQPPKNNVGYYYEDSKHTKLTWEGQEHEDRLRTWLEGLQRRPNGGPNLLVAFGSEAMFSLTGKKRVKKWRGSVLPCTLVPGYKVYVSFHPSYVNRLMNEPVEKLQGERKVEKQNALPLFLRDLERIKEQGKFREYRLAKRKFFYNLTLSEILEKVRELHSWPTVAVDIETLRTEHGPIVWCIGFAAGPEEGFTIPLIKRGQLVWTAGEEERIWQAVSEFFLAPNVSKVFQNGGFDLAILGRYYGLRVASGTYHDTMWCFQATYPYLKKALETLTSIYTWEPYYKDDGKAWDGRRISDEAEYAYNIKDCCVTREIWPKIKKDAEILGTWGNYLRHMKVMPSLLCKMIRGVRFDSENKEKLQKLFQEKMSILQLQVNQEAGFTVNINSTSQLQRLLYGQLGLPLQYNHKSKKPTTDKDALNRLKKLDPKNQCLDAILDYKKFAKLVSTYTAMEGEEDGRVRTSYSFISTFRLNSFESHFGKGGNLQNIPVRSEEGREIRKLFVPDENQVLLASDLEQAEAREVAWLSGDFELMEAFEKGLDVHWENAKAIFQIPESVPYNFKAIFHSPIVGEDKTLKELRDMGKTVSHARNYGMGPLMLQTILIREGVFLDAKTCKALMAQAKRARPMINQWQGKIREEIRLTRTLITPLGDKREFRGRFNDNLFRSAYAFVPQSTVGRLLQLAIQRIHEELNEYEPLLNVHDEVVGQCKPEDVPYCMKRIKDIIEIPHEVNGRTLIIPCSFKMSDSSWGELESIEIASS